MNNAHFFSIVVMLSSIALLLVADYNFVLSHELVHRNIFDYYDVPSEITIRFGWGGFYGYTSNMGPVSPAEWRDMGQLHMMADAYDYHYRSVYITLLSFFVILVILGVWVLQYLQVIFNRMDSKIDVIVK